MYKRVDSALNKGNISEAIDAFSEYLETRTRKNLPKCNIAKKNIVRIC